MFRPLNTRPAAFLITLIALLAAFSANAQQKVDVRTEVLYQNDAVHPGTTTFLALNVQLDHGYHVNSNIPLETYLIPTVIKIDAPEGITLSKVLYPEAIEIITGGSTTPQAVYEEEFTIGIAIEFADSLPSGDQSYTLEMSYQACNDRACFQPRTLKLDQTIKIADASTQLASQHEAIFAALDFEGADQFVATDTEPDTPPATTTATVENADEVMALLNQFDIEGTSVYINTSGFLKFIENAKAGIVEDGRFEGKGPIAIVLLVLLGGIALNLTPCVLPLVPINLAIIGAGAQAGSRSRGFALGLAYGLAMAVVYGTIGLVVILTAGTFGTINASPWFNIAIAFLFIFLGLAMFDVIQIDFSKFQSKFNLANKGKKGSLPLAFGMGGISALLAGACVAPIVIQVIVFSSDLYAKGTTIALALPFFLGLGMAIPWPLAGAGMGVMPKPGAWMVRVKQGMGVFVLAFAAYYGYLAYEIFDARNVDSEEVARSAQEMLEGGWTPSITEGLQQALDEDKLVIVDMWASWCKNCLVMDKTTLKKPEVKAALDEFVKIKFQAEDLDASPANEILNHFEGIGLPTYAILRPKNTEK